MTVSTIVPHAQVNILSAYCLVGLAVSTVAHISTFTPWSLTQTNPLFFILHLGIFPVFFLMVFQLQKRTKARDNTPVAESKSVQWAPLLSYIPRWALIAVGVLVAYSIFNFVISVSRLSSQNLGDPTLTTNFGNSASREDNLITRAFSGHWMLFYSVPALFYTFVPKIGRSQAK